MTFNSLSKINSAAGEDGRDSSFFVATLESVQRELEGRYEILEEIGQGGMGIVYKARQPALRKLYAIKMLHSVHNNEVILRFEREAKAISKLGHINLITSHDFGVSSDGRPFMVMDFIEGTSLAELIHTQKRVPLRQTLEICLQVARGMSSAHNQGVLHRDLKPGNIMLITQPDGKTIAKIIDFGIAKVLEGNEPHNLTQTGDVFGSPYYMSPEQAVGRGIDERSDIYSLGCVMYEMLTGVLPFRGGSAFETLYMHMNDRAPSLKVNAPDENIPQSIERVVSKALEKEQSDRWQSMSELANEIEGLLKILDSPLKSLIQNLYVDVPRHVKVRMWQAVSIGAVAVTTLVALVTFWPTTTAEIHEKPEVAAKEYLREQHLDDPNELAKPMILNGGTDVAIEMLDLNDQALKWFRERNDVLRVNLSGTSITGDGMKYLTHLPLHTLLVNNTGVSDSGLVSIGKMKNLQKLELNQTFITSAGLESLSGLSNLRELHLIDNNLRDTAIDTIIKFPKLEYLNLSKNTMISDDGINKLLANCHKLKVLRLGSVHVSDEGLEKIDQLNELLAIDLNNTDVTDKTIAKLVKYPLREVYLSNTNVTDKGVLLFKQCGTLNRLSLISCPRVSKNAIEDLRNSLAHCKVFNKPRTRRAPTEPTKQQNDTESGVSQTDQRPNSGGSENNVDQQSDSAPTTENADHAPMAAPVDATSIRSPNSGTQESSVTKPINGVTQE